MITYTGENDAPDVGFKSIRTVIFFMDISDINVKTEGFIADQDENQVGTHVILT